MEENLSTLQQISKLEEEILLMTIDISRLEREFERLELEASLLLKEWIYLEVPKDKQSDEKDRRISEIKKINLKEEKVELEYFELRRRKDEKTRELRNLYLTAIKDHHKNLAEAKKKGEKISRIETEKSVPLEKSSLLSGTSMGGSDDADYSKIFQMWNIDDIELVGEPKKFGEFYGRVVNFMGKEIYVKEFRHVLPAVAQAMDKKYEAMKKILGHRSLLTPIGRISAKHLPPDSFGIALELAANKPASLQDALFPERTRVNFSFNKKVQIAQSICDALAWLHESDSKTAHLRLKPSNVLFTKEWKVKVSDYGIGLPFLYDSDSKNQEHWFKSFQAHFTAPEIFKSPSEASQASDIWSYGLILLTIFKHTIPYSDAKSYDEIKAQVLAGPPEIPDDLPSLLQELIKNCLKVKPKERILFKDIPTSGKLEEGANPDHLIWQRIMQDAAVSGNKEIKIIWNAAAKSAKKEDVVLWEHLKPELLKDNKNIIAEKAVQFYLGSKVEDIIANVPTAHSQKVVLPLLNVWRPFLRNEFALSILSLVQKPWYMGLVERPDVEGVMNEALEKKFKNPFIVRNAARAEYKFIFCSIVIVGNKPTFEHLALEPEWYQEVGLIKFVEDLARNKGCKPYVAKRSVENLLDEGFQLLDNESKEKLVGGTSSGGSSWRSNASSSYANVIL